ncbi:MAG: DUF4974 domain-containing protein [Chloroflexota bacterium]|nr:DUF4974 domain-containing protein [Chloroflexota bacterium]
MNKEVLHKYISGNCTSEEEELVEEWLNESLENTKIMEQMKLIWGVSPGKSIEVDSHAAWKSFKSDSIDKEARFQEPKHDSTSNHEEIGLPIRNYSKQRGWYTYRVMTLTAAIAAVFLVTILFNNSRRISDENTKLELVHQEIITKKGQQTTVGLSDGTRIYVNAESKLSVPQNYMDEQRIVYLEGEAFFEVTSDETKPFIVQAGHSVTRVLGTKFNVTAYPEEQKVQVVVAEGKVALRSSVDQALVPEVQLKRNQLGAISINGEIIASKISDASIYTDWFRGKLTFQDTPLDEVAKRLERWYDVEIKIDNDISTSERLLHGTFEDASLTSVLNSIALSLDIQYKRNNKEIHFMPK